MWNSCWHEYGCPRGGLNGSIAKAERQCSLQDVPRLVVGVVDVQVVWTTAAPLMNNKGLPGCRDGALALYSRLLIWNDNRLGHDSGVAPLTS